MDGNSLEQLAYGLEVLAQFKDISVPEALERYFPSPMIPGMNFGWNGFLHDRHGEALGHFFSEAAQHMTLQLQTAIHSFADAMHILATKGKT